MTPRHGRARRIGCVKCSVVAHMAVMRLTCALMMLVHHALKILRFAMNALVCLMKLLVGQHGADYRAASAMAGA